MFTANDYKLLRHITFRDDYPGYVKEGVEYPDGKFDPDLKMYRYAHVAQKYLKEPSYKDHKLVDYLEWALDTAEEVAVDLGVPAEFWPTSEDSTLRILEYDPGSVSPRHTDFCLFTLHCYRNLEKNFVREWPKGGVAFEALAQASETNPGIHFGELMQHLMPGIEATPHWVKPDEVRTQNSIVFFAMPPLDTLLPNGVTVREWVEGRKAETRVTN